jgi:predicted nucleic acid-binding protein
VVVLDASAVVELLLGGERAVDLRKRLGDESAHAPYQVEVEVLIALRRHASRLSGAETELAKKNSCFLLISAKVIIATHHISVRRCWFVMLTGLCFFFWFGRFMKF